MKKTICLLLSLMLTAGSITILPGAVSADAVSAKTIDFSTLGTQSEVAEIQSLLGWDSYGISDDEKGKSDIEIIDRGDENGAALRWYGTGISTVQDWKGFDPYFRFSLDNALEEAQVNTQSWLSFDFKMDGSGFMRKISFFKDKTLNSSGSVWSPVISLNAGESILRFDGASTGKTVVDNGWHNMELCIEKTGDAASEVRLFLDGCMIAYKTFDTLKPFGYVQIEQGIPKTENTTGAWSFDNIKEWQQNASDDDREMIIYKIDTAADMGTVPEGISVTDVPGSCGKPADDKVIRMAVNAGGSSSNAKIEIKGIPAYTATDKYDLLLECDMKADDLNWQRNFGVTISNSAKVISFDETGKITQWGAIKSTDMLTPVGQFNRYALRFTKAGDMTLYVNGDIKWQRTAFVGTDPYFTSMLFWAQYTGSVSPIPGFATEFDNYRVRYIKTGEALPAEKVYRNYGFTGIENNVTAYQIKNGKDVLTQAAPDMAYQNVSEAYGNTDAIRSGFAGKTADDRIIKFYSAKTGSNYKAISYNSDNSVWGGKTIQPGAAVRGGVGKRAGACVLYYSGMYEVP